MGEIASEYKKMLDRAFKEKIKKLAAQFKMDLMIFKDIFPEKILCEFLIKNKDFFPLHFMHFTYFKREATSGIYSMHYLGEINGRNLFLDLDKKIICEEISKNQVGACKINELDIFKIVKVLEEKAENGVINDEVAVPEGYVALSHKYTFISMSGCEEEGYYINAYQAGSLDEALNLITRLMGGHHVIKRWNFRIFFQGKWYELKSNVGNTFYSREYSYMGIDNYKSVVFTLKQ